MLLVCGGAVAAWDLQGPPTAQALTHRLLSEACVTNTAHINKYLSNKYSIK